jgi:hypothetical protein
MDSRMDTPRQSEQSGTKTRPDPFTRNGFVGGAGWDRTIDLGIMRAIALSFIVPITPLV